MAEVFQEYKLVIHNRIEKGRSFRRMQYCYCYFGRQKQKSHRIERHSFTVVTDMLQSKRKIQYLTDRPTLAMKSYPSSLALRL